MRFYTEQHRFYAGIDLHARTLSVCILDQAGQAVRAATLPASPRAVLDTLAPFRDGLVVACECMFAWYWLADLCHQEQIPFVLGHALYMKAIHGGKAKNDRIDAEKIARLLRGGTLPVAYVYPKGMRETRDLLRRWTFLVRRRAELLAHLVNTNSQYNLPPLTQKLCYAANRHDLDLPARFTDPSVQKNVHVDLALIDAYDDQVRDLELYLTRTAKVDDPQAYQRLRSVPGVGKVLALIFLYEIHDVRRFAEVGPFLSYARLGRCAHESAGKKVGSGGKKIGNAHLKGPSARPPACWCAPVSRPRSGWPAARRSTARRGPWGRWRPVWAGRCTRLRRKQEAFDAQRFFAS